MNAPVNPAEISAAVLGANAVQVRKIGNSLGLILPKELLSQLRWNEGDVLTFVEQPDNGVVLRRKEDLHAKALEIARKAMVEYADTLRELAK
jgi:putative addiction module antidote